MAEAPASSDDAVRRLPTGGLPRPVGVALLVGTLLLGAGAAWLLAVRGEAMLIDLYAGAKALLCL